MSLEFALQYACPLRADYSERHLREWGRLSSLHAKLTTGDAGAPTIDKLEWVEKASAEIEQMQRATTICAHCPACLPPDRKGTRLNSSHRQISYAVFCLKKKNKNHIILHFID